MPRKKDVSSKNGVACDLYSMSPYKEEVLDGTVKSEGLGVVTEKEENVFGKVSASCSAKVVMAKKIEILKGCIACGLCTMSPYIEELSDGTVKPKGTGIVAEKDEKDFLQVVSSCPAKVILLKNVASKSKTEIITSDNWHSNG